MTTFIRDFLVVIYRSTSSHIFYHWQHRIQTFIIFRTSKTPYLAIDERALSKKRPFVCLCAITLYSEIL